MVFLSRSSRSFKLLLKKPQTCHTFEALNLKFMGLSKSYIENSILMRSSEWGREAGALESITFMSFDYAGVFWEHVCVCSYKPPESNFVNYVEFKGWNL